MKFLSIFLVLLAFPLISAVPTHKFYVSITKIEYVKEKNSLQIITKIFIDDIEVALRERFGQDISLATSKETETADNDLKQYILQNLKIKVNGKNTQLRYLGKEYETDMVVAYLEVEPITSIKTIAIENKILMEIFPEQQNIIHLKTANNRKSLILDQEEPAGSLNF